MLTNFHEASQSLLAQVPLTVSPFVSLPTATTLPYTYKSLPSSLPPSSTIDQMGASPSEKPRFVVASSGQAAHPDEIFASCQRLQAHLEKQSENAKQSLNTWEEGIEQRELAEKRRVAPGWLDRDERILQPSSVHSPSARAVETSEATTISHKDADQPVYETVPSAEAEELDRAFGTMNMA